MVGILTAKSFVFEHYYDASKLRPPPNKPYLTLSMACKSKSYVGFIAVSEKSHIKGKFPVKFPEISYLLDILNDLRPVLNGAAAKELDAYVAGLYRLQAKDRDSLQSTDRDEDKPSDLEHQ